MRQHLRTCELFRLSLASIGTCKGLPDVDTEKTASQTACKPYETSSFAPGGVCAFAEIHKPRKKSDGHHEESLFSTFSRSSSCTKRMYRAVTFEPENKLCLTEL